MYSAKYMIIQITKSKLSKPYYNLFFCGEQMQVKWHDGKGDTRQISPHVRTQFDFMLLEKINALAADC